MKLFEFDNDLIKKLLRYPSSVVVTNVNMKPCSIRIVLPKYIERVLENYKDVLECDINYYHDELKIPTLFTHFGLIVEFYEATELAIHDSVMVLPEKLKMLLQHFGVVILKNVYHRMTNREVGHRNRFPQLNFHVDRIKNQESFYSIYTRDPFDEEQKYPRTSSTLFVPMLVGYLQGIVEGKTDILSKEGIIKNAELFDEESIKPLLNDVVVEHKWDMPEGVGEISMINNCEMLHASYYPDIRNKGYRIGVRYLA